MKRILGLVGAALLCSTMAAGAQSPGGERTSGNRMHMKERMERYCAKQQDPAKCQAEAKSRMISRMEERQKMHEACNGKRGDELAGCLREQHKASPHQHRRHRGDKPRGA